MSNWKSIKNNPPPVLTEVLLLFSSPMLPKDILVGYLDDEGFYCFSHAFGGSRIQHTAPFEFLAWQELPEVDF